MLKLVKIAGDELRRIDDVMSAPVAGDISRTPSIHYAHTGEDRIVGLIDRKTAVQLRCEKARDYIDWFEPAWMVLNREERDVLSEFYLSGKTYIDAKESLENKLAVTERTVEHGKARALEHLSEVLYLGLPEAACFD
jgi:hypothetical protein